MIRKLLIYALAMMVVCEARVIPCIRHTKYIQNGYLPDIMQLVDNFNAHEQHAHKILVIGHKLPQEAFGIPKQRAIEVGNVLLACGVPKDAIELQVSTADDGSFVDMSIMTDFFFTTH